MGLPLFLHIPILMVSRSPMNRPITEGFVDPGQTCQVGRWNGTLKSHPAARLKPQPPHAIYIAIPKNLQASQSNEQPSAISVYLVLSLKPGMDQHQIDPNGTQTYRWTSQCNALLVCSVVFRKRCTFAVPWPLPKGYNQQWDHPYIDFRVDGWTTSSGERSQDWWTNHPFAGTIPLTIPDGWKFLVGQVKPAIIAND